MHAVVMPATEHVEKGSDFLTYLTERRTDSGWPEWGKALAYVHMGDLAKARELLVPLAEMVRTRFPELGVYGVWGHNLLELLRLIDEDPAAIPAHCEAVARQSVKVSKLDKFWVPTPFVYERAPTL